MYKIIDESNTTYTLYEYDGEAEFESMIIDNSEAIFGGDGIYFAMKSLHLLFLSDFEIEKLKKTEKA